MLPIYFRIQSVAIHYFVEMYEEKEALQRHLGSKGRRILIAFSNNCGYFSFILHQQLMYSNSLNVRCNVESEATTTNFW